MASNAILIRAIPNPSLLIEPLVQGFWLCYFLSQVFCDLADAQSQFCGDGNIA
jgi:hypothetical protein